MAIFISIGAFIVLAAVISFFGYRYYTRPGRLYEQLGGHAAVLTPLDSTEVKGDVVVRVIEQLGEVVPVSPDEASVVGRDLVAAGFRSPNAVSVYMGLRILFAAVVMICGVMFRSNIKIGRAHV